MRSSFRLNLSCAFLLFFAAGCGPAESGVAQAELKADAPASDGEVEPAPIETAKRKLPVPPETESSPDPSDERIQSAEAALTSGDYVGLQSIAEAILEDHPKHGYARLLLGLSLHKRLLYERAIPEFEAAIRGGASFEKYNAVWHFLGWAFYNTGRLELARGAFENHLSAAPNEGDSHFALGLIDADEGSDVSALERFRRSVELNMAAVEGGNHSRVADVAKAHARIADLHLAQDRPKDAVLELERCVTLWPAHYTAWFKLYRAHTLLGNDDLAAASMKQHDHWKAQANEERKPDATKQ